MSFPSLCCLCLGSARRVRQGEAGEFVCTRACCPAAECITSHRAAGRRWQPGQNHSIQRFLACCRLFLYLTGLPALHTLSFCPYGASSIGHVLKRVLIVLKFREAMMRTQQEESQYDGALAQRQRGRLLGTLGR